MPSFIVPHSKFVENLSCHSNQRTWATAIKKISFVEVNVINNSTKFQLYFPYLFWGDDILIFFHKFNLSVAMTTNQIQMCLDKTDMFDRGLLKEHAVL